jgi:nitrogen fixation protein NifX
MDTPHLRVAITTDSLLKMDANFAAAKQVVFYDVDGRDFEFVDVVPFRRGGKRGPGGGPAADGRCVMDDMGDDDGTGFDPLTERIDALKGCSVLFTMGLSDLAAMRIHDIRVFPVKSYEPRPVDAIIANLQRMMNGSPPLWLRRVMRGGNGSRLPLEEQEI